MKYFARRVQLERLVSPQLKYESVEFGAEAETFAEAIKEVEEAIKLYQKKFKAKLEKPKVYDKNELPFTN